MPGVNVSESTRNYIIKVFIGVAALLILTGGIAWIAALFTGRAVIPQAWINPISQTGIVILLALGPFVSSYLTAHRSDINAIRTQQVVQQAVQQGTNQVQQAVADGLGTAVATKAAGLIIPAVIDQHDQTREIVQEAAHEAVHEAADKLTNGQTAAHADAVQHDTAALQAHTAQVQQATQEDTHGKL